MGFRGVLLRIYLLGDGRGGWQSRAVRLGVGAIVAIAVPVPCKMNPDPRKVAEELGKGLKT